MQYSRINSLHRFFVDRQEHAVTIGVERVSSLEQQDRGHQVVTIDSLRELDGNWQPVKITWIANRDTSIEGTRGFSEVLIWAIEMATGLETQRKSHLGLFAPTPGPDQHIRPTLQHLVRENEEGQCSPS